MGGLAQRARFFFGLHDRPPVRPNVGKERYIAHGDRRELGYCLAPAEERRRGYLSLRPLDSHA